MIDWHVQKESVPKMIWMEAVASSVIIAATKPIWKWQNGILKLEANVLFYGH